MKVITTILISLFSLFGFSQSFVSTNNGVFKPLRVSNSDVGDYDNDGDLDIIIMGLLPSSPNHYTEIYNNDGNGNFTLTPITFGDNYRNGQVEFVDYDNDNDLDVFISGLIQSGDEKTALYRNDSGTFIELSFQFSPNIFNSQFAWGDLDNDGDLDLIVQGNQDAIEDFTYLYRNEGGDNFSIIANNIIGYSQGKTLIGDLDNDGDNDIICGGVRILDITLNSRVYRNNGDFTFTEMAILDSSMNGDAELRYCDNNNFIDFIRNGQLEFGGGSSSIYLNQGNYAFTEYVDTPLPTVPNESNIVSADYTGNGELDFLISGNSISIYTNSGNLTLSQNNNVGMNESFVNDIEVGDFDNDHAIDVFVIKNMSSKTYINQSTVQNSVPFAPTILSSEVSDGSVTLSWNLGTDNETPVKQLSYNLYIGSAPNSTDIVSPMADLTSGYRKIVTIGNVQYGNNLTINNLEDGIYYWAVQSIDNQYEGSLFSEEQTFIIGEASIDDDEYEPSITFFPNPVEDELIVKSKQGIKTIRVFNDIGQELKTLSLNDFTLVKLNLSQYESGIYFLSISTLSGNQTLKILKQ